MSWYDCMLNIASTNYMNLSAGRFELYEALHDGNVDVMMQLMKSLFAGVTKSCLGNVNEGYYRNMMYMLFVALGVDAPLEGTGGVWYCRYCCQGIQPSIRI